MLKRRSHIVLLFISVTSVLVFSGCAASLYPGGPSVAGFIHTDVTDPAQYLAVALDPSAHSTKVGRASASAFLGFASGDSGIDAAMRAGGITKVHHVDHQVELYFGGFYVAATTIVYGE